MTDPGEHVARSRRRFFVADPMAAAVAALRSAPTGSLTGPDGADSALVAACRRYVQLERRRAELARKIGPNPNEGEVDREANAAFRSTRAVLRRIVETPATSLAGHRARAAAFLAWDDGDLMGRSDDRSFSEDRMLAALVFDLVNSPRNET